MVYGEPGEAESITSVVDRIRSLNAIETEVNKALECCEKPGYRFWPKIYERNYIKKVLSKEGSAKFSKPALHPIQRGSVDELMKVSIEQAIAGPRDEEMPEFWEGKSVSRFAIYIFRTHLFSEWKKLKKMEESSDISDGLQGSLRRPKEISISQLAKEDQSWDTLKEFGEEDSRLVHWNDDVLDDENDPFNY